MRIVGRVFLELGGLIDADAMDLALPQMLPSDAETVAIVRIEIRTLNVKEGYPRQSLINWRNASRSRYTIVFSIPFPGGFHATTGR